jgi:hypothetical protein
MYRIYLDDIRTPSNEDKYVVIRSAEEAIDYIKRFGMPVFISFDHDLGQDCMSGYDFAKWITESCMDKTIVLPTSFSFHVHSANPVGAANIQCLLNNFLEFQLKESLKD